MTKYIWITVFVIALILILAYKQASNEPDVTPPLSEKSETSIVVE